MVVHHRFTYCTRNECAGKSPQECEKLLAALAKHRWIPVAERLPTLEDRNELSRQIDDGTINVFGHDDGIVFTTNYFPKMGVWNGLTPIDWRPILLPEDKDNN